MAKAVCAACRVRRQCLQYALATHQLHGVWGGTSEDERQLQARREREQRDRRDPRRPARAEPGGNGARGRGNRIRSV
jgi:WhiB family redox-sensing transcriptional regulator